jgi:hypothetical protein
MVLKRNISYYTIKVLQSLLAFYVSLYFADNLSYEEYSMFQFFIGLIASFTALNLTGMNQVIYRSWDLKTFNEILSIISFKRKAIIIVLWPSSFLLSFYSINIAIAMFFSVIICSMTELKSALIAYSKINTTNILNIIQMLIPVILIFTIGIDTWELALFSLMGYNILVFFFKKTTSGLNWKSLTPIIILSFSAIFLGLAEGIERSILFGKYSAEQFAVFAFAISIGKQVFQLSKEVYTPIIHKIQSETIKIKTLYILSFYYIIIILISQSIIKDVFMYLIPEKLHESFDFIIILLFCWPIYMIGTFVSHSTMSKNKLSLSYLNYFQVIAPAFYIIIVCLIWFFNFENGLLIVTFAFGVKDIPKIILYHIYESSRIINS